MTHYQAAVDAHRSHNLKAALASYQEVIAINPGIAAVHNNVAAILLSQGKKLDAEASWRKAIKLKPEYAEAHYNLAIILSERGDEHLSEAQQLCELAIAHKDGYAAAHHLLGNILSSLQQLDDARTQYQLAEVLAGGGSTPSGGGAPAAATSAAASFRWEGVEIGHVRTLEPAMPSRSPPTSGPHRPSMRPWVPSVRRTPTRCRWTSLHSRRPSPPGNWRAARRIMTLRVIARSCAIRPRSLSRHHVR